MRNLFNRFSLFALSLVVAYFSVWAGDGLSAFAEGSYLCWFGAGVVIIVDWVVLLVLAYGYLSYAGDKQYLAASELTIMKNVACTLPAAAGLAFGAMASPITRFGNNPFAWATSAWLVMILGSLPWIFEVRNAWIQKLRDDRTQAAGENVHKLRGK